MFARGLNPNDLHLEAPPKKTTPPADPVDQLTPQKEKLMKDNAIDLESRLLGRTYMHKKGAMTGATDPRWAPS